MIAVSGAGRGEYPANDFQKKLSIFRGFRVPLLQYSCGYSRFDEGAK